MEQVHITSHDFEKTNLFTKRMKGGLFDEHTCKTCGLSGRRYGFSSYIEVRKAKKCTRKKERPTMVELRDVDLEQFGFKPGEKHRVVECPIEYKDRFSDAIWIYSEKRKEPVRILEGEYREVMGE